MQRRVINEINNFIRIIMVGLTTTIIIQLIFILLWSTMISAEVNIRGRGLELSEVKPIPCNAGTNGTSCVCPSTECLLYNEKIDGCHPIDCWKWNSVKQSCEEAGKEMVGPIILQAIPFTGYFGSGFGNMGRWDIFGTYWIVLGSGCVLTCLCGCFGKCVFGGESDKEAGMKLGTSCGSCLFATALTVMWIWGIVVIANKEVDAPYWDWEGKSIMCPLI